MKTTDVIEYFYSCNNKEALFKLDEESIREFVISYCNILSEENEYADYGTYGEHYEDDVDTEAVVEHIMDDYKQWKNNKEVRIN